MTLKFLSGKVFGMTFDEEADEKTSLLLAVLAFFCALSQKLARPFLYVLMTEESDCMKVRFSIEFLSIIYSTM